MLSFTAKKVLCRYTLFDMCSVRFAQIKNLAKIVKSDLFDILQYIFLSKKNAHKKTFLIYDIGTSNYQGKIRPEVKCKYLSIPILLKADYKRHFFWHHEERCRNDDFKVPSKLRGTCTHSLAYKSCAFLL